MKTALDQQHKFSYKAAALRLQGQPETMATVGPHHAVQAKRIRAIDHSPRQIAQQKWLDRRFGRTLQKKNLPGILESMGAQFHTDFSTVQIHAGSSRAGEVGAMAFTQGEHIHFAPGQYQPHTAQGKRLLGHELAHVVQQREGRVAPTGQVAGMPLNDNPALEKEADDMGRKVS